MGTKVNNLFLSISWSTETKYTKHQTNKHHTCYTIQTNIQSA